MKWILPLLILVLCPALALPQTAPKFTLQPVLEGLNKPLFLTHDPQGRLYAVEQGGLIHALNGAGRTLFLDLREHITDRGSEQGLLGLAFHPRYPERNEVFVFYTAKGNGANTLARVAPNPNAPREARPSGLEVMLSIPSPAANHNGGMIAFGPDGMLYVGTGDGGGAGDPLGNAQNLKSLLGKLLRIDPDGGKPYGIPVGNPYKDHPGAHNEIWTIGLRNPWRFSFDRASGDLWIGDVGQNRYEEINHLRAGVTGRNFGWNVMEGRECFPFGKLCRASRYHPPVAVYGHDQGCSVTGGYVYRGKAIPGLTGVYLFGDYCSGKVWGLWPKGHESGAGSAGSRKPLRGEAQGSAEQSGAGSAGSRKPLRGEAQGSAEQYEMRLLLETGLRISSFGEDRDGELYVINHQGGRVYRIVAGH